MGIDDESSHPRLCSEVADGVTRNIVCLFREPDAGNLPVRFDEAGRAATQWRVEGASIARGRETCSSANGAGCIHASAGSVVRKDRYHSRTLWSFKSFACTSPAFIDNFKAHRL
jgi:hypothetical protein